jgi:hypothetical protein
LRTDNLQTAAADLASGSPWLLLSGAGTVRAKRSAAVYAHYRRNPPTAVNLVKSTDVFLWLTDRQISITIMRIFKFHGILAGRSASKNAGVRAGVIRSSQPLPQGRERQAHDATLPPNRMHFHASARW